MSCEFKKKTYRELWFKEQDLNVWPFLARASVHVCVCVCVRLRMRVMHARINRGLYKALIKYTHRNAGTNAFARRSSASASAWLCVYVCVSICMYVCVCVCIHVCVYMIYTYTYVSHIHIHIYACLHAFVTHSSASASVYFCACVLCITLHTVHRRMPMCPRVITLFTEIATKIFFRALKCTLYGQIWREWRHSHSCQRAKRGRKYMHKHICMHVNMYIHIYIYILRSLCGKSRVMRIDMSHGYGKNA